MQFISASLYSLGHGGNDAQKTMGIIAVLLYSQGALGETFHVPLLGGADLPGGMLALGTLVWRLAYRAHDGFEDHAAQPDAGFLRRDRRGDHAVRRHMAGHPVSTTHTITGAIIGVGAARRVSAVRWGIAGNIVWAWIITIPATAAIAAVCYWVVSFVG
jgi:PiT family inorganic phosphate transporter